MEIHWKVLKVHWTFSLHCQPNVHKCAHTHTNKHTLQFSIDPERCSLCVYMCAPHGVQQSAVLHNAQKFVGHSHVVRHRLLAVVKESVWSPDFTGHQVVETQDVHWPVKLQTLVCPALAEKHIHRVFLRKESGTSGAFGIMEWIRFGSKIVCEK